LRVPDVTWESTPAESWEGYRVDLHKRGLKLYLGQYGGSGPVILEAWMGDEQRLRVPIASPDAARDAAYAIRYRLKNGWGDETY
jgi:hypothetical protein